MVRVASRAWLRVAAAMLGCPAVFRVPMAKLRKVAMTRGPLPAWAWAATRIPLAATRDGTLTRSTGSSRHCTAGQLPDPSGSGKASSAVPEGTNRPVLSDGAERDVLPEALAATS